MTNKLVKKLQRIDKEIKEGKRKMLTKAEFLALHPELKTNLKCECGHDKEDHNPKGSCDMNLTSLEAEGGAVFCDCKKFNPVIPLAQVRRLWEESDTLASKRGYLSKSIKKCEYFNRKLRELEGVEK